jgi:prefoldin subunit 5
MPNFDGTGPEGKGPLTGLGRGYCVMPLAGPEQELEFLKKQAAALKDKLQQLEAAIEELSARKKE